MPFVGLGVGVGRQRFGVGGGFDADYQAVLDYATTQGYTIPSAGQQTLQNQLVVDLKNAGIWSKLDTFGVFATDGDSDFALIDWIRLSQYTAVNSPTFTTNQGFTGNGTSSYINVNYNPSTNAVNLALNSNHIMAGNLNATANAGALISSFGATFLELTNDNPNSRLVSFNMSSLADIQSLGANAQNGTFISTRNSSANYELFKNGVSLSTPLRLSSAVPNAQTRVFARSNGSFFGYGKCPYISVGGGLTNTQVTNFNTALTNYYNAL